MIILRARDEKSLKRDEHCKVFRFEMAYYIHQAGEEKKEARWAIYCAGGVLVIAVLIGTAAYCLPQNTDRFDHEVNAKMEKLHRQILDEQYREIFLEGDRELIASYDEAEFTAMLGNYRQYLMKKPKSTIRYTIFQDSYNHFRYLIGAAYRLETYGRLENNEGIADEYIGWRTNDREMRLSYYTVVRR